MLLVDWVEYKLTTSRWSDIRRLLAVWFPRTKSYKYNTYSLLLIRIYLRSSNPIWYSVPHGVRPKRIDHSVKYKYYQSVIFQNRFKKERKLTLHLESRRCRRRWRGVSDLTPRIPSIRSIRKPWHSHPNVFHKAVLSKKNKHTNGSISFVITDHMVVIPVIDWLRAIWWPIAR